MTSLLSTLTYTPSELAFGTSGLRGLVTAMTDLECIINTIGFLQFLEQSKAITPQDIVYLAGDLRDSTPRIMRAVVYAITSQGYQVNYCGLIPTPAVALYAGDHRAAAIMVSGSHIPADRNGIKYYKPDGEVYKSEEADIKTVVAQVRQRLYDEPVESSAFSAEGSLKHSPDLPTINPEAATHYMDRYRDFFPANFLAGKQIVLYQHSAVVRDIFEDLLKSFGAEVITVGRSDRFIPIDTEHVTASDRAYFEQLAQEHPDCFAILSTDGDSDRPFMIDERGTFYSGDLVGCLTAIWLGATHAAFPITTNNAVITELERHNIKVQLTKIGSPYVVDAMEKAGEASVGWEVNGGFLTARPLTRDGKTLAPLPTRDSILPLLAVLAQAVETGSVSRLFASLPARYTASGLLDNIPMASSQRFLAHLATPEGQAIFRRAGFGAITDHNELDGARFTFDTGEIVHIRPSGNAPQLRTYAVADTSERAQAIVSAATAPDGWLAAALATI